MSQQIPQEATSLLGETIAGYELVDYIGKGFSGFVFMASKDGTNYAVKILKQELISDQRRRTEQLKRLGTQVDIGKRLDLHAHLIKIIDAGECGTTSRLYIAMTYLSPAEYEPLSEIKKPIEIVHLRLLLGQIAGAAQWLHDNGYAHRDIKPSNILIHKSREQAVLLDLGVTKDVDFDILDYSRSSQANESDLTTPRYSPSEIHSQEKFSAIRATYNWGAASIYQLGLLIYVMLTGEEPFSSAKGNYDISKVIDKGLIASAKSKRANDALAAAPKALTNLMRRSTSVDWERRVGSVRWSEFEYVKLEPTVVILYAGGTIGSEEGTDHSRHVVADPSEVSNMFSKFEKRIKADYAQLYEPNGAFPFRIQWEALASEDVVLSENATPAYWNALLRKMKDIIGRYGTEPYGDALRGADMKAPGYLAGVIVLHGTDTMAYTAAALTFAMRNLPCPVIITGSNQPPNVGVAEEFMLLTSNSDVWRNLRLSMNFIRTLGHRYTELFVVFNATVFHGINLKKVPLHNAYESGESPTAAIKEPYTYQSIYLPRKYMFKWIDGFLCNNFYPIYGHGYHEFLGNKLHTRKRIFGPERSRDDAFRVIEYQDTQVELVVASPVTDYSALAVPDSPVIMLVGYDSGTFPSVEKHRLSVSLRNWEAAGKSTFIISEFGLFPTAADYQLDDYLAGHFTPIPLYGVIKETAIPLVLHLLSKVDRGKPLIAVMKEELAGEGWQNALPGMILGNPFEHAELGRSLRDHIDKVHHEFTEDEATLFNTFNGRVKGRGRKKGLPPELSLWFILRKCKKAFSLGYGPTAFKELNDMGIKFGRSFFKHVASGRKEINLKRGRDRYVRLPPTSQKAAMRKAQSVIKEFCARLKQMGVVQAAPKFSIKKDGSGFTVTLEINSNQGKALAAAGAYSAKQFDEDEAAFFRNMTNGTPYQVTNNEYHDGLERSLKQLADLTWQHPNIQPMGWLVLGIFKGLLIEVLLALQFDDWVVHFTTDEGKVQIKRLLKTSIQTEVTQSKRVFDFVMTYVGREMPEQ